MAVFTALEKKQTEDDADDQPERAPEPRRDATRAVLLAEKAQHVLASACVNSGA